MGLERDGVRVFRSDAGGSGGSRVRASVWLLLVAGLLSSWLVVVFARWAWDVAGALATPPDAPPVAAAPAEPAPVRIASGAAPARRQAPQPQPPPEAPGDAEPRSGTEPTRALPPPAAAPTGIALYPPPGTDPPKVGVVVPEDWPLPEGYVRHYQTTDDGQMLQAILMFHPDYELLDEHGEVIPLPDDLVVPPDLAPPGMPIEELAIPAPRAESEGTDAADLAP